MSVISNNQLAGAAGQGGDAGYKIDRSLRFNSADSANLSRTPSTDGSKQTFTLSTWVKRSDVVNSYDVLFGVDNNFSFYFTNTDKLYFELYAENGSSWAVLGNTQAVFRDVSAWYHVVISIDSTAGSSNADRIKCWVNGVQQTLDLTGYWGGTITGNIARVNSSSYLHTIGSRGSGLYSDFYLADYHFIDGQGLTASDFGEYDDNNVWQPKEFAGTYGTNGFYLKLADNSSNAALGTDSSGNSNTFSVNNLTAAVVPVDVGGDPTVSSSDKPFTTGFSVAFDGNDKMRMEGPGTVSGDFTWECWVKFTGTPSGRFFSAEESVNGTEYSLMRFYNGNLNIYVGDGNGYEANTYTGSVSADTWHHIAMVRSGTTVSHYLDGSRWGTNTYSNSFVITTLVLAHGYGSEYFTGSVSNARFVNGQALYTGASYTVPTATLTTTSQSATATNVTTLVAHKASLTANDGTKIEILNSSSDIDSLIDTPTNYTADSGNNGGNYCSWNPLSKTGATLANGNLEATLTAAGAGKESVRGTIAVSSGKFYWEELLSDTGNQSGHYGVVAASTGSNIRLDATSGTNAVLYAAWNGNKAVDGTSTSYGASFTTGDIIGVALDLDAGTITFYKNNSSQGSINLPTTGIAYTPTFAWSGGSSAGTTKTNWGQRSFSYTPPTGFLSLCTQNLADPPIADGSTVFDTKTWQGDGVSNSRTISGYNFSPDLVWGKTRNAAYRHMLYDTVRGPGKDLRSDTTAAEGTNDQYGYLSAFNSDGFSTSAGSSDNDHWNHQTKTYVAWAWDAGTSNTSISAGSLNSSVYNQSYDISPNISTSSITFGSNQGLDKWFNGDKSDKMEPASSGSLDFTSISGLQNFSGTLQFAVTAYNPGSTLKFVINATTDNLTFQANTFPASGSFPSTLLTIPVTSLRTLDFTSVSGQSVQFWGVYLDGKLLVDSSQTPPNVPAIASTVRANPSAGFSIVSWTGNSVAGSTVGHNLNAQPGLVIIKNRDRAVNWVVGHLQGDSFKTGRLYLNTTGAQGTDEDFFNDTNPTSSVFTVKNNYEVNYASEDYLALVWAPVEGYSAFGSYTGNGSYDGPFVYTGFRPKFILRKQTNSAQHWHIVDTARDPENVADSWLFPNLPDVEGSGAIDRNIDLLSNGFKIRSDYTYHNQSGSTYIYAAFAENPFKTARAR